MMIAINYPSRKFYATPLDAAKAGEPLGGQIYEESNPGFRGPLGSLGDAPDVREWLATRGENQMWCISCQSWQDPKKRTEYRKWGSVSFFSCPVCGREIGSDSTTLNMAKYQPKFRRQVDWDDIDDGSLVDRLGEMMENLR